MREHYTKLTRNRARCNHCNDKFNIHIPHLHILHKHLVEAHPEKLTEGEENEVKFHWIWDYYIAKSNTEATCKLCKVIVRCKNTYSLNHHLKRNHEISGPTSDNVIDNENNSDGDMDANKDVEGADGTEAINEGTPYDLIPIRRWMREHYTKLTRNRARCNHCNERFIIHEKHKRSLHKHLTEAHPDQLTEEEKNEVKFDWTWDYYMAKSNTEATCGLCKVTVRYTFVSDLKYHLKRNHEISGPTSDNVIDNENSSNDDMDANRDITLRKAKRQEDSSNSINLSDNLYESAEGTEGIN
ncbi:uncharacterized protein, partial [Mycetomoellerius zeteki]|uniref:uncharacterized protein n=1 Tax=Mycetomoellerius zeteki TaxID=64791 RepID=UPI00084EC922